MDKLVYMVTISLSVPAGLQVANSGLVALQEIEPEIGWLVEQGLTSHSTQFRSFRRRCFYRSDDPTNSVKALKEGG